MRFLILVGLLVITAGAPSFEDQFKDFKSKYGKAYLSQADEDKHFEFFKENVEAIEKHNALYEKGQVSYKKAVNLFADFSRKQFEAMLGSRITHKPNNKSDDGKKPRGKIPASVDWREKGHVTEVKSQGACGSCWSFSVTGAVEAAYYRKTGKLVSLSEQQLIDCTNGRNGNQGCNGGLFGGSFMYVREKGLQSEASYPFEGKNGKCRYSASDVVTKISKFTYIRSSENGTLLETIARGGPVAAIVISTPNLSEYSSGIFEDPSCLNGGVGHAVLIAGYGTENGTPYWLVKNTWGPNWGEQGYFRIVRGRNECGIGQENFYPIID